jgi:hypothetical protein
MKMEQTECSETSAFKLQTPVDHPKESIKLEINPLTPELNPSTQRYLPRFFTGDLNF